MAITLFYLTWLKLRQDPVHFVIFFFTWMVFLWSIDDRVYSCGSLVDNICVLKWPKHIFLLYLCFKALFVVNKYLLDISVSVSKGFNLIWSTINFHNCSTFTQSYSRLIIVLKNFNGFCCELIPSYCASYSKVDLILMFIWECLLQCLNCSALRCLDTKSWHLEFQQTHVDSL